MKTSSNSKCIFSVIFTQLAFAGGLFPDFIKSWINSAYFFNSNAISFSGHFSLAFRAKRISMCFFAKRGLMTDKCQFLSIVTAVRAFVCIAEYSNNFN